MRKNQDPNVKSRHMVTREPQYQEHVNLGVKKGFAQLGLLTNATWDADPKRLVFILSRYKFVAKMLSDKQRVLEVGCGDAFGTRIVLQEVGHVTAVDFDPVFVQDALERMDAKWAFESKVHDILMGPVEGPFDAAYALDVLEHVAEQNEATFISNIAKSLAPQGVLIIGIPSLQSQKYASPGSKEGHVNCQDAPELKALLLRFFHNVFIFSMNDEVVHTGFHPMAHYFFALCVGCKK